MEVKKKTYWKIGLYFMVEQNKKNKIKNLGKVIEFGIELNFFRGSVGFVGSGV